MVLKVLFLSVILMAVVFFLMAVKTIFKKRGTFPNLHIGGNPEMKRRGIYCVTTMDKVERKENRNITYMQKKQAVNP